MTEPVVLNRQPNLDQLSIARLVPVGSRVLDLGCGTGELLDYLIRERGCSGYGVEIDDANVQACVARGCRYPPKRGSLVNPFFEICCKLPP